MTDVRTEPSRQRFLRAIADPVRWQILEALALSDRRVHELTDALDERQNLVSYHLRELRSAGLVTGRRSSADGRDTYYRFEPDRFAELLSATGTELHPGLRLTVGPPPTPEGSAPRTRRRPRVLFLCTGNSARSQMAEAFLEHLSGHTIEARSAGSHPKALHPAAVLVMAERAIDIAGRDTKHWSAFGRSRFDHVVTLCDRVREVCPELPGHPRPAHWSIPDPTAEPDATAPGHPAFRRTAEQVEARVRYLVARLTATGGGHHHAEQAD